MRVAVFGANGGVGRQVVTQALARGHAVVAVSRGDPLPGWEDATHVRGDVKDAAVVGQGVVGCEAVISCLGMRRTVPANPWSALASPLDFSSRTAASIVAAMKACGVSRVRAVSAAGVGDSYEALNWMMRGVLAATKVGTMYADLQRMEGVYRDSGLDWMCVRAVTLTDGTPTGTPRVVEGFGMTSTISRPDVATYLLDAVGRDVGESRTPMVAG